MKPRVPLSRAKETDWCVAARGIGTFMHRDLMPKTTYGYAKASRVTAAILFL